MIDTFDSGIILWINKIAAGAPTLSAVMSWLVDAELFKGGIIMAVLWWVWFRPTHRQQLDREVVLAALAAGFVALFVARALSWTLPFRLRPMFAFPPPFGALPRWNQWSSFPSDHAALYLAMTAALYTVSRRLAVLASLYVLTAICVPRLYGGLHYPTDVIFGALLGLFFAIMVNLPRVRTLIARPGMWWRQRYPGFFYAAFFLLTYEIATLFLDLRTLARLVVDTLHASGA